MHPVRRACSVSLLVAAAAAAVVGCSSSAQADDSASGARDCVDASLPNASAEELVDVLKPQPSGPGGADDTFRQLATQFDQGRDAQVARVRDSAVFKAVPTGGDAAFAKAVCSQSRWDDVVAPDGSTLATARSQRGALVAAGHNYCDAFEQLRPSATSTGAWSDWSGYVAMMTKGDPSAAADAQQVYAAALANICPQFAS
ncbi:hypothetical protein FK531_16075 [Rhodococcus spelaei]|uniref:DUF732 domain-containing protein n=1 Tax=Rhodococcus spelaei TaxID=2546320 RepID=A0A541B442_9NOCA|nr:hypothetical protein [Rhodococcus spelaei]TQF67092.1 hypothetical protein FK531_16075 [Rhodococcus spelaei]